MRLRGWGSAPKYREMLVIVDVDRAEQSCGQHPVDLVPCSRRWHVVLHEEPAGVQPIDFDEVPPVLLAIAQVN